MLTNTMEDDELTNHLKNGAVQPLAKEMGRRYFCGFEDDEAFMQIAAFDAFSGDSIRVERHFVSTLGVTAIRIDSGSR